MSTRVGVVVVAHSAKLAEGVVELAGQMAGDVALVAAGGTADGGIGTDFDAVSAALGRADSGAGVVVLCDLGSAIMAAEMARDFLPDEQQLRIRVADAPLVEGAIAAAVEAETGARLDAVLKAAEAARGARSQASVITTAIPIVERPYSRTLVLHNKDGLHARPAAEFVKLAARFEARVTVNGKDARSLLAIMSLGLVKGATIELASAADGAAAVDALAELVEAGFGEGPATAEAADA